MHKIFFSLICIFLTIITNANDVSLEFMLINNYSIRNDRTIWQRMRSGYKLNHKRTKLVEYYEIYYTKNPKAFAALMNNATPYLYYILTQTERYGLPSELALIPIVESKYDPLAANPTDSYAGMWQFIPTTGARFNLLQNNDFDERRNFIKSTNAALYYLNYLYLIFKQWDVAIGAYNWGEGGMLKAINASKQTVGNVQYNKLKLRNITKVYVPKIIALANIISNPKHYNVQLDDTPNKPYFAIVYPKDNISIKEFNAQSELSLETFKTLNPQFKKMNVNLNANTSIIVPVKNEQLNVLAANDISNQNYEDVNLNDPINLIGYNNNKFVRYVNNSNTTNQINQHKQRVIVAKINTNYKATYNKPQRLKTSIKYKVIKGDTLYSIAKKFNTNVLLIKKYNKINGHHLQNGQILTIKKPTPNKVKKV